ncbi:NAD(P)/FAD-dependent oxidoreductase [Elioraea thermophila]|uniref:NAD(P)/FAD-dependent oxidoreductase n=1 Tax=Elioraea thermophila TaxID=2185104 RepID=UPI000DF39781|nr:FAD-dependent oxidoreductase [Elioraea thermophila]
MHGTLPPPRRERIAVIGAGIAGLSAAWLLRDAHDVVLYEAEPRLGGHADTQAVEVAGEPVAVDTGFIVYNEVNYPNLVALFAALGVATEPSDMSFSVARLDRDLEYAGGSFAQLFADPRNALSPRFWGMLADVLRFYRRAPALLASGDDALTLGDYLDRERYGAAFVHDHLLPMGAAIWSASVAGMREFPARAFVQFFQNHGLLRLSDRPRWRTVTGGSRRYVARIAAALGPRVRAGRPVVAVRRDGSGVWILREGDVPERFDRAVLAVHGDQALRLLAPPTEAEARILSAVRYQENRLVLHTDAALMPRRRKVWSSWNYLSTGVADETQAVSVSYWMNRLQNLNTSLPLIASLNPFREPDPRSVLIERLYRHPQYDPAMLAAQKALPAIQGRDRVHFCGAWCGYGFHEDGIASAVRVAEALGAPPPWRSTSAPAPGEALP